jgi:hypothetical protein
MKAIARLTLLFFTATPFMRGLVTVGLVLAGTGMLGYLHYSPWTLGTGMRREALWFQLTLSLAPWLGLILLLFASSLLVLIVERMALGRLILVLPYGRIRLLTSVLLAAGTLAALMAATAAIAFLGYPPAIKPPHVFSRTLLVSFADLSLLYAALWLVSKTRGAWLLVGGSLLIVFGIASPLALIANQRGLPLFVGIGLLAWLAFATLLLFGARLRHALGTTWASLATRLRSALPPSSYATGGELPLLLGTDRPWIVALGQSLPVFAIAWLAPAQRVWLIYVMSFGAISSAVTSIAAARSRVLWLRYAWTRDELFQRVERAYWRHNAYAVGVLLVLFSGIGSFFDLPTPTLAHGLVLIVLGGVVSSYLGLIMTKGLGSLETVLGIATMGLLIYTANEITEPSMDLPRTIALEAIVAALAVVYRIMARGRWQVLDWRLCRSPVLARGAG